MKTLSLCMIVKNEESVLARVLKSAEDLFDEIIIVDTGSTDNTIKIAESFNAKIYNFKWINNFSAARNFAFEKATCNYVMWLDADDIITKENLKKLKQIKSNLTKEDCVMLKYVTAFNSSGKPEFWFYRERILKNDGTFIWVEPIHEVIVPHGKIVYADAAIEHHKNKPEDKTRNLEIYNWLIKNNYSFSPRLLFYYGLELYYNNKLKKCIKVLNKFVKQPCAWQENLVTALVTLSSCHMALNCPKKSLNCLLKTFEFAEPRAKVCFLIGNHFYLQNNLQTAICWYEMAINLKPLNNNLGFNEEDYNKTFPALQLCECHYKLGNKTESEDYNELALKFSPNNETALSNKKFFESLKK